MIWKLRNVKLGVMEAGYKATVLEAFQSNYVTLYSCCGKLVQIFRYSKINFFSSLKSMVYGLCHTKKYYCSILVF